MLYKVTPMLTPEVDKKPARQAKDPNASPQPRKRRKSAVYDAEGNEVLITMMCLKCRTMKPLGMFGLRKMADGAIRNQPWCRTCRSGASTKKKPDALEHDEAHDASDAGDPVEVPAVAEPQAELHAKAASVAETPTEPTQVVVEPGELAP